MKLALKCFIVFVGISTGYIIQCKGQSAPSYIPSFGPNATHWPKFKPTPFLYDLTTPHIVHVSCSWSAIASAVKGLSVEQVSAGTLILVAPGQLTGLGAGGGDPPVVKNIGDPAWSRRVTIAPEAGYGSIHVSGGTKFDHTASICWAGWWFDDGFRLEACTESAIAWSRTGRYSAIDSSGATGQVRGIEIVEVVKTEALVTNSDVFQCIARSGAPTNGFIFAGCYLAPNYFVKGTVPKPHCDSLQFFNSGANAAYTNMTLQDCVIFASNNSDVQTGNIDGLLFDHSALIASTLSTGRYPVPSGGDSGDLSNAVNGAGQHIQSKNSYFYGGNTVGHGDSTMPWSSVVNTRISYNVNVSNPPNSGSWTVDSNQLTYTAVMPPLFTEQTLLQMWRPKPPPQQPSGLHVVDPQS